MEPDEFIDKVKGHFGEKILSAELISANRVHVEVDQENLVELASYVKHELGFNYPDMLIGTDRPDEGIIELIYYVGRMDAPLLVGLTTKVNRDNPVITSMTRMWNGFEWFERETFDLLGVLFEGHPDLRRIYLPEDWDGYPLREDYIYKRPRFRKPEDFDPDYYQKKF